MNHLISIIIPNYNRADLIGETLDSILEQTYTNWECIIVDDGSTDNSKEVIQNYVAKDTRFQLHDRPEDFPKGANACRNYGFELSKGEYVNWFDSDDLMLRNFLQDKIDIFDDSIEMVIATGYITDNSLQNRVPLKLQSSSDIFKDFVLWNLKLLTPSILFRKSFLHGKELFSNRIIRGQETDLLSRLLFNVDSSKYRIIDKPLFLYRQHANTKNSKNKQYNNLFKESQAFINIEILKKGFILMDKDIIKHFYNTSLSMFFNAIVHLHLKNIFYIFISLFFILIKNDFILFIKFFFIDILITPILRLFKLTYKMINK